MHLCLLAMIVNDYFVIISSSSFHIFMQCRQHFRNYLFHVGTDSGMTYNAPNGETVPQELIHYITKKSNLPHESSFHFGGSKVPSLAKIIFHHDKTEGECSKKTPLDKAAGEYSK